MPEALRCATFFPEPGAAAYVAAAAGRRREVWKVHVQVGGFDVRDPLLDEAWGLLADAGTPVVHPRRRGPVPTALHRARAGRRAAARATRGCGW